MINVRNKLKEGGRGDTQKNEQKCKREYPVINLDSKIGRAKKKKKTRTPTNWNIMVIKKQHASNVPPVNTNAVGYLFINNGRDNKSNAIATLEGNEIYRCFSELTFNNDSYWYMQLEHHQLHSPQMDTVLNCMLTVPNCIISFLGISHEFSSPKFCAHFHHFSLPVPS